MKLIILNGSPGVGKSTLAARLQEEIPASVLIDIDELRRGIPGYHEKREESLRRAHELAEKAIEENFTAGYDVIIDKAISYSETIDSFIGVAKKHDADVYEFLLFADKQTVQKRADDRGYRPGSMLTREKVGEMWEKSDRLRSQRQNAILIDTTHSNAEKVFDTVKKCLEHDKV